MFGTLGNSSSNGRVNDGQSHTCPATGLLLSDTMQQQGQKRHAANVCSNYVLALTMNGLHGWHAQPLLRELPNSAATR